MSESEERSLPIYIQILSPPITGADKAYQGGASCTTGTVTLSRNVEVLLSEQVRRPINCVVSDPLCQSGAKHLERYIVVGGGLGLQEVPEVGSFVGNIRLPPFPFSISLHLAD